MKNTVDITSQSGPFEMPIGPTMPTFLHANPTVNIIETGRNLMENAAQLFVIWPEFLPSYITNVPPA